MAGGLFLRNLVFLSQPQIISIYYFTDIVIWNLIQVKDKVICIQLFIKTYAITKQSGMQRSKCMKNTN